MKTVYREKRYYCGEYLDVYIYPTYRQGRSRGKRSKPTSAAQAKLNQRHREEKNNVIEFANGKYYIMGAEVYFTGSLAAHEAYLGDFSYIIGNYSQDITVVRSEHSGLATNSIDYLGACVFDSKPVAGFGAFVHLAKAAA